MLQWMDDFTSYGTDANRVARMLDGPYAETTRVDLIADPDPTAGGKNVLEKYAGGLGGSAIRKVLTGPQTTVGIASRVWLSLLPQNSGQKVVFASFRDVNNVVHIEVTVDPSGNIQVYRGGGANNSFQTLIGQTATPAMIANAWRHVETKVVFDNTNGSVQIRLEGVQVLNITGVKTTSDIAGATTTCSQVAFESAADTLTLLIKDFIVWDGSGTVNNDFFGSCQVYKIQPDADVSLNWTPSSGTTGFNLINGTTPDDDSGYISAPNPTLPSPAQFTLQDLPSNVTSVRGVMVMHRSRKTDGGDGQLQASLISGANTGNGANRTITTAYTYWWDMFDQDPSGTNWSKTLVNALNLKLNRTV